MTLFVNLGKNDKGVELLSRKREYQEPGKYQGKMTVEFYDARYPMRGAPGQFISSYFIETLLDAAKDRGINLDGGVPEWNATAEQVRQAIEA